MPFGNLGGWTFVILIVVVILLFGAPKLPKLAKSIGESMRIFRGEMSTMKKESSDRAADEPGQNGATPATNGQGNATTPPANIPPADTPPSSPQADGNDTASR